MKILVVGDVHWSEYSSILRKRGPKFSKRLENLINTINWVEETAEQRRCDCVVYLGDFFDRTELNANELTALQEVIWAPIPHKFIVGNHEGLNSDLSISSAHLFSMVPNVHVIDKPELDVIFGFNLLYLPYILEEDRKPLPTYLKDLSAGMFTTQEVKQTIVFSHNDLKMKYGMFESVEGFIIDEIESSCNLFLNGHLHNNGKFCSCGYNVGNITGQNFGEDALIYNHHVVELDLTTGVPQLTFVENPYALHFYRLEAKTEAQVHLCISKLKDNSIVTIKVPESLLNYTRSTLSESSKVKEHRVVCIPEVKDDADSDASATTSLNVVNHLEEFVNFVKAEMDVTDIVLSELSEVCK